MRGPKTGRPEKESSLIDQGKPSGNERLPKHMRRCFDSDGTPMRDAVEDSVPPMPTYTPCTDVAKQVPTPARPTWYLSSWKGTDEPTLCELMLYALLWLATVPMQKTSEWDQQQRAMKIVYIIIF